MAEVIHINHERLLARTLALREAREKLAKYLRLMEVIAEHDDDRASVATAESDSIRKLLHQIDEALK